MSTPANSSDLLNASAAILAKDGRLMGITIIPAAAASSVTVYDNASAASGKVIGYASAVANGASATVWFNDGVVANSGIYASVSGASAQFIIHYHH